MELRHVRTFITVADAGGFSSAARQLHLSQPALSRQIRALEDELGVRLFLRVGRRVGPTAEGLDLLRRGRALLAEAASLGERARALSAGHTGVLRVGATPQTLESVLGPFLARYRGRHPGVEVHLTEDGGPRLLGHLERAHVQLAVTVAGDARFSSRPLFPGIVLAVMVASHRLRRRRTVEVTDLADEGLLLLKPDFGTRQWFDAACRVMHVRPRLLLESAAPHTLVALARAGYGVALVPSNFSFERSRLHVAAVLHRGASLGGWIAVNWDPRRFLPPYAEAFIEELTAYTRTTYPGHQFARNVPPPPRSTTLEAEAP